MGSFICKGDAVEFLQVLGSYYPEGYSEKGQYGMITYRTESGGVVHFWPTTNRILCQGTKHIAIRLDRLLRCYLGVVRE